MTFFFLIFISSCFIFYILDYLSIIVNHSLIKILTFILFIDKITYTCIINKKGDVLMSINARIKYIRENANLSQSSFAKTLGLAQATLSNMEQEGAIVKEQNIRLICKTYMINYIWLKEGVGEIYVKVSQVINKAAIQKYKLDELDKAMIEQYVKLEIEERNILKSYLKNIFKAIKQ